MAETLNARETLLVAIYVSGKRAETACVEAGYSKKYARKNAHLLIKRPHIAAAIAEAQEKVRQASLWTAERLLAAYEHAYEQADKANQTMSMVRALDSIGRLTGLNPDKLAIAVDFKPSIHAAIEEARARRLAPIPRHLPPMIDITPSESAPAKADDAN